MSRNFCHGITLDSLIIDIYENKESREAALSRVTRRVQLEILEVNWEFEADTAWKTDFLLEVSLHAQIAIIFYNPSHIKQYACDSNYGSSIIISYLAVVSARIQSISYKNY